MTWQMHVSSLEEILSPFTLVNTEKEKLSIYDSIILVGLVNPKYRIS